MLLETLNGSKLFAGLMMIFLNIGSKFVTIELSSNQKQFLANSILRQVLVFAVAFVGTRDLVISLILTAVFTILVDGLLHETSPISILPKSSSFLSSAASTKESNGPFGFLRIMAGVPANVQNPAFDTREPVIGTT
jgi:uncharacterized membrane protein (DUF485 family)